MFVKANTSIFASLMPKKAIARGARRLSPFDFLMPGASRAKFEPRGIHYALAPDDGCEPHFLQAAVTA